MNPELMITPATGGLVGIETVLYISLYLVIPAFMIFAARKNWNRVSEKSNIVEFVGFWRRVAIAIIDGALNCLVVPLFFQVFYYLRDGQTIGDKIYGTRIVDKKTMKVASVGKLLIRPLAKLFSFFPLGFGFITAGWRTEKRAWHDGLADVRYISYKKVHGIWTWIVILLPAICFILIPFIIGIISGYQKVAMQAVQMSM